MTDEVRFGSETDGVLLSHFQQDTDVAGFDLTITGRGLRADLFVEDAPFDPSLSEFFQDLAVSWKGWSGEKKWRSLNDELRIDATCDRTGHVTIIFTARPESLHSWQVKTSQQIEAGQLDSVAVQIRTFFRREA